MVPTIRSFTTLWVTSTLIYFSGSVRTQTIPECNVNLGLFTTQDFSPCEVLVTAMTSCARNMDPNATEYTLEAVSSQSLNQYPVPILDSASPFTSCDCTDVSYNLHQACAACQNGLDSNVTLRSLWFRGCKGVQPLTLFNGVSLKLWMTQIYEPSFSVEKAVQVDQSGNPLPVTSSPVGTSTSSSSNNNSSGGSNIGMIVGAAVGGVAFLVLLLGLFIFFVRRRNARKRIPPSAEFMKYAQERNMNTTTIPLTQAAYHPREDESRNNPRGSVIRFNSGASEMDRLDPEGTGAYGPAASGNAAMMGSSRGLMSGGSGEDEAPPAFTPGLFKDPVFEKGVALNLAAANASSPSLPQPPLSGGSGMGVGVHVGLGGGPGAFGYGGSASPSTYSPATPSVNHSTTEHSRLIHGKRGSTT
ncbi:hypothetical protein FRC16_010927 [Serendipita sp. 398]|nr:hypothetical protein FRC16_010927 [Serendipita sp. 398]